MSFRSSVFSACLAAACSALGVMPANDWYGVECGLVKDRETLNASVDLSLARGYVVGPLRHALWCACVGETNNAPLSVDDLRDAVAALHAGRVYPVTPYCAVGISGKHFPEYVQAWMTAASNDFPVISAFVLSSADTSPRSSLDALIRWAFDRGVPGLLLGEFNRSTDNVGWSMEYYTGLVKAACTRQVKIMLRRSGKSFVTRGGVNPLEPYAKRLETILNAPRMHGMADFCAEIGLPKTYAIPEDSFLTDDEIKTVCDSVLIDDRSLKNVSAKLRYSMGTDAYNAFVKEYNEGTVK